MAKKKQEGGAGTGMIITLVFFVLTSLILGVTTYMGFDGQAELENDTKKAKEELKTVQAKLTEEQIRVSVNRIAIGSADEDSYTMLSGASGSALTAMMDEHNRILSKVGGAFPTRDAFAWPVMQGATGGDPKLAASPKMTIPAIAMDWSKRYQAKNNELAATLVQLAKANSDKSAAEADLDKAKAKFAADLKAENDRVTAAIADNQAKFAALKVVGDKTAADFKAREQAWAAEKAEKEEAIRAIELNQQSLKEKLTKALNNETSDYEYRFRTMQLEKLDSRKGEVVDKGDGFVNLKFDNRLTLVPGQSFVVISPTASLTEVLERERALEKRHREYQSLYGRQAFADNELVKGMVEVTDVSGPYTARARITHQVAGVRNPISKRDQVFNVSLSTAQKEHVAFCGIIDLDGDGLPNNEEFVRLLEKNGLVLDSYLDVNTGEVRNRQGGMTLRTKFLIVGTDAPQVGKVKEMVNKAKELGIQQIDATKFLALMGVKPPTKPATPNYGRVNLGTEGAAAPPPMAPGDAPPEKK